MLSLWTGSPTGALAGLLVPDSGPGLAIVFLISLERLLIFSCFERELVLRQTARWVRQLRRLLTLTELVAFLWFDSCWALWVHPNQPLQPFSDIFPRRANQLSVKLCPRPFRSSSSAEQCCQHDLLLHLVHFVHLLLLLLLSPHSFCCLDRSPPSSSRRKDLYRGG